MQMIPRSRLPAWRIRAANGSSSTPHSRGGSPLGAGTSLLRLAAAGGNWIVSVMLGSAAFAGNVHELLVSCAHVVGVMTAVAPAGKPVTVNKTGVGKMVPALGTRFSG